MSANDNEDLVQVAARQIREAVGPHETALRSAAWIKANGLDWFKDVLKALREGK